MALHTVIAEAVIAADRVWHGWPLPAEGTFSAMGSFPGITTVPLYGCHQRAHASFQFTRVDEGEQKDEELGEAVPEQLAVHILKADVAGALWTTENCPQPEEPLAQGGKPASLKKNEEVQETSDLGEAVEEGQCVPGLVDAGFSRTVDEKAVRSFFKPLLSDGAQGKPQLLPLTHRPVPLGLREIVLISDVEQGLPYRGTLGTDGEPPQK